MEGVRARASRNGRGRGRVRIARFRRTNVEWQLWALETLVGVLTEQADFLNYGQSEQSGRVRAFGRVRLSDRRQE